MDLSACCTIAAGCWLLAAAASAEQTKYDLDISGTSVGQALLDLARQTHVQVLYPYQLARIDGAQQVHGRYTVPEALDLLLKGTGYTGRLTPRGVIEISVPSTGCPEEWGAESASSSEGLAPSNVASPNCRFQATERGGLRSDAYEIITVTGYRASLAASADTKRTNVGISDSVFAENIGKFPDRNLAEAINRIPGIQLQRSDAGEGITVSIRGLGPSFTQVLLDGNQIAVASDTGGTNREVDIDMFPVELFSRLTVAKTPVAHLTEGGVSGTVNIVNLRPFDKPDTGFSLAYSLQSQYSDSGNSFAPRGAIIASQNWDDKFGVLVGIAAQHYLYRTDGYESIGVDVVGTVDQEEVLGQPVCPADICALNTTASKNFHWASVVPPGVSAANAAAYGLGPAGTPYKFAGPGFTTAGGTSGLSIQDLSRSVWPHLPRFDYRHGQNDRLSLLMSVEYQPSNDMHLVLDAMFEHQMKHQRLEDLSEFNRQSCNVAGTNGPVIFETAGNNCQVPVNVKLDGLGNVTSATLLNSSYILDNTENTDNLNFYYLNPSMEWKFNDWLTISGSGYFDDSQMNRHMISLIFQTPPGSGLVTNYSITPGRTFPLLETNAPLNDPNGGWQWYITRAQPISRSTITEGSHWDITLGGERANVRVGYAYDRQYRNVENYGATGNMGTCIAVGSTAANPCTLPDGTVEPIGTPALVPNSTISQYLISGPKDFLSHSGQKLGSFVSFVVADLDALAAATKIRQFEDNRTLTPQVPAGSVAGSFDEKNQGVYVEANGDRDVWDREVRLNAGIRYVTTSQKLTAPLFLADGVQQTLTERGYDALLPSLNLSLNAEDNLIIRLAGARTMTRANPQFMYPGISFPTATLSPINAGNPDLRPYFSDNFDLGIEYYTGGAGIIAVDFFAKEIANFTTAGARQVRFGDLGIPTSALTPTQLAEYNANGGDDLIVTVNSQQNLKQKLHLSGFEVEIVQPLDFICDGLGVTGNYTRVQQSVDGGLTAAQAGSVATGIAPYAYNLGAYYESNGLSLHAMYNFLAKFVYTPSPAYSGIPLPEYQDARGQLDLSASYLLPGLEGTLFDGAQITFDAVNLNNATVFTRYVGDKNQPSYVYWAGRSFMLGFRGKL